MTNILGAIWAQTCDGIIGRNGTMPWHVPEDLKHFQQTTAGKPVIMGRRTWESLPDTYKPLPGRVNIIVSRSVNGIEYRNGCTWVSTLDAALKEAHRAVVNQENTLEGLSVEPAPPTRNNGDKKPPEGNGGAKVAEPLEQEPEQEQEEVATEPVEPEPTHADVWIIGGGALYSEALTRDNLPHYKHVSVIERTLLTAIDGTVIHGDTKAPVLTGWETVTEQPLRVSESGYLLDEQGEMCPAVYTFQTLEKVCAI